MPLWLLIPIKSLQAGKSRLAPVLSDAARRGLNEHFLRRTVQVASEFPGEHRTAIISESEDVLRLAGSLGVCAIRQTRGPGLNGAAAQGVDQLRALGAGAILIIASDLPLIRATDLYDIATRGREQRVVICPDKHYTGTNGVFLSAGTSLAFHFGAASFAKHCREAQRWGLAPLVHFNRRIAMDIDVPADLRTRLSAPTGSPVLSQCRPSNAFCDEVFPSWWNGSADADSRRGDPAFRSITSMGRGPAMAGFN